MLQRTVFINEIRMLQRTRRNTIGRRSTRVRMTCRAFPLWLERQSSSLLSFVMFSYQFSSVICAFSRENIFLKLFFYIILAMSLQNTGRKLNGNFALGCGPRMDYSYIDIFQCVLVWTDAITNEVLEPTTFVLAYPTLGLLQDGLNVQLPFDIRFGRTN